MEEDKEILKGFIETLDFHEVDKEGLEIKHAIENLLTRLKDYEQIEKEHQKENGELREKVKELEKEIIKENALGYSQGIYDCSEAWKETIREKIEVRKQSINDIQDNFIINEGMLGEIKRLEDEITVLQDLLEENK